jgi:hypothetical protein
MTTDNKQSGVSLNLNEDLNDTSIKSRLYNKLYDLLIVFFGASITLFNYVFANGKWENTKCRFEGTILGSRYLAQENTLVDVKSFVITTCKNRPPSHNHHHMFAVRNRAEIIAKSLFLIFYTSIFLTIFLIISTLTRYGIGYVIIWVCAVLNFILHRELFVIFDSFDPQTFSFIVQVVALLHDVTDHKYLKEEPMLATKLKSFLDVITTRVETVENTVYKNLFTKEKIMAIIERISFSRQKDKGTDDWSDVLGYFGKFVRDIVSDADKLEAIGRPGIDRCASYVVEKLSKDNKYNKFNGDTLTLEKVYPLVVEHYHEKLKILSSKTYIKTPYGQMIAKIYDRDMQSRLKELGDECRVNPHKIMTV